MASGSRSKQWHTITAVRAYARTTYLGPPVIRICSPSKSGPSLDRILAPPVLCRFFNVRQHTSEYAGPGRDLPAPIHVAEVSIGYFGPSDLLDPLAGDMWRAAEMAVEEANAQGGLDGRPFRLMPAWSQNPWEAAVKQLADSVFQRRVWLIVGGADSATTHLAEQTSPKLTCRWYRPSAPTRQ